MIRFRSPIGSVCLDVRNGQLWKGDVGQEAVRLTERPLAVLCYLAERPGDKISREQILRDVWPSDGTDVNNNSIDSAVTKIRAALGDQVDPHRVIQTLRGYGYRFIALVESEDDPLPGVRQELATGPLQIYYQDTDLRAHNLFRYSFSINDRHIFTDIATSKSWLSIAIPIRSKGDGQFTLLESSHNPWYSVPANEVELLAKKVRARGIRFENRPIYSLRSFVPGQKQIASFSVGQYADYKIEMGGLEDETNRAAAEIARIPNVHRDQLRSIMPLREKLLPTSKTVAQFPNRLCAGGTNILLAFRTPNRDDYMFFIKQRSASVSSGRLVQSLIPSGMHQPSTWFVTREETSIGATVYREMDEELFGGDEPNPDDKGIQPLQFMSLPHIAWFRENPKAFTLEIVSFGLNLVDGTFEFGVLLAIHDPSYWAKCADQESTDDWRLKPNFEVIRDIEGDFYTHDTKRLAAFKTQAPFFTNDTSRLVSVMTGRQCADVSLIALIEGLRRLHTLQPGRVKLPPTLRLSQ